MPPGVVQRFCGLLSELLGVKLGHQRLTVQAVIAALGAPEKPANEIQQALRSQLQQSNETFVIHYRQTYSEPELPPIWAMTELISLGTLRAWIAATELDSKTKVARSLGMPSAQVLNGVLHSLNLLRNISAHHGRLWNRLIVKRLPKIKKLQNLLVLEDVDGEGVQPSKKLYNYLVVMAIIVRKVAPLSTWPSRMAVVMTEMGPEQQGAMGCPVGWQQQQIWS